MSSSADFDFNQKICFHPIGVVRNPFSEETCGEVMRTSQSEILLDERLTAGLKGLEVGQNLLVIFHFNRALREVELRQHPRGNRERPKRGVFSLRSPRRPNAIGATEVTLLGISGNVLKVYGLDAYNETPVLDLKPTG